VHDERFNCPMGRSILAMVLFMAPNVKNLRPSKHWPSNQHRAISYRMKSSIYKLSHGVYSADLDGRKIERGSVEDLAAALVQAGITADNLLLGDWREDAELLSSVEQTKLRVAMTAEQGRVGKHLV
jgi:hypothetical protein